MDNNLRDVIESVLRDVHVESGRKDEYDRLVNELESAISEKIINRDASRISKKRLRADKLS